MRHKERGYRLKDNIHFHMYISTSPCGDGRLNSPYEITSDSKKSSSDLQILLKIIFILFFPYQYIIESLFSCNFPSLTSV